MKEVRSEKMPIPGKLNILILTCSLILSFVCLYGASHSSAYWVIGLWAVIFSFVNNTTFSLLHEAVHGLFNAKPHYNQLAGHIAAALFPTTFHIQQAFHLNHHQNNRSEVEQFDYLHYGDNRFLKYTQWYSILTGFYWVFPPVFNLIYAISPALFRIKPFRDKSNIMMHQSSAHAYLNSLAKLKLSQIRLEVMFSVLAQISIFLLLDLTVNGWLICYLCFAVNWSALQYADHAFSPLNAYDGAWNLKINPVIKTIFLNYHDHLTHHRRPSVPWLYLPKAGSTSKPQPSFLKVYLEMWKGPRPIKCAQRMSEKMISG
jgi:fatty acid desaturase